MKTTRFDAHSHPLLKLLQRTCLDNLFGFEIPEPPIVKKFYEIGTTIRKEKRMATPSEIVFFKSIKDQVNKYFRDAAPYMSDKKRIGMGLKAQETDEILAKTHGENYSSRMDALCQQRQPYAYYLPSPTTDLIMANKKMLSDKFYDLIPDFPTEIGLQFGQSNTNPKYGTITVAYSLDSQFFTGLLLMIKTDGQIEVEDVFHMDLKTQELHTTKEITTGFVSLAILSLIFIHFFQVEKVVAVQPVINSGKYNRVTLNDDRYDSNLNYPLNIIDAKWWTTIIRTDPFLVKGHFRRQPYGPGKGQYKMIYIKPHQKNGYTRRAKHSPDAEHPIDPTMLVPQENLPADSVDLHPAAGL